jgi:hypothetical protein
LVGPDLIVGANLLRLYRPRSGVPSGRRRKISQMQINTGFVYGITACVVFWTSVVYGLVVLL